MSLRIPPRVAIEAPQSQLAEPPSLRRKVNKRRVDSDEDDDDGDADPLNIRPQMPTVKQPRISELMNDDSGEEIDLELQNTVETKASHKDKDDAQDPLYRPIAEDNDSENDPQEQKRPGVSIKQKSPVKRKATKAGNSGGGSKTTKGKATKEPKETMIKHKRGGVSLIHATPPVQENPTTTNKRSRPKEVSKEEISADVIATTPEPHKVPVVEESGPAKEGTPPQPPLKKRKLPTIKKTKTPASTCLVPPFNSVVSKAAGAPGDTNADEVSKLPAVETRIPAANVGSADFDLRKPSVYAELFKSGSIPRSGLNRRERDEERRKELYKMRDEARAKRAAEAKHTFDLQGQRDKISRFEERLRHENSSVLFPNFLAAKFKDDWERQRRRNAEKDNAKKENCVEGRPREEGETDDRRGR